MSDFRTIADIRREYGDLRLDEDNLLANPFEQFKQWFKEILVTERNDPTAVVLSTVDEQGWPDSRVVLLKGLEEETFIFYTNYESAKAKQLQHTPYAALNFYWPQMARQVRVRGRVNKVPSETSDAYFASRPHESQLSALASPQSQEIANRKILDEAFNKLLAAHKDAVLIRPQHWGGYCVHPDEIEFWQGRDNRLHDRIQYVKQAGRWHWRRLAP